MRKIAFPLILATGAIFLLHSAALAAPNAGGGRNPSTQPAPTPTPTPTPTPAPTMRTYVSGLGNDSNLCSISSPCQTFQRALAVTAAGGAIFVRDSANYGPATITKAVTITSEGAMAGVLATSG